MPTTPSSLLTTARKILDDAANELAFLYQAQAEDVLTIAITTRSGQVLALPVSRKRGACLCKHLIAAGEKRVRRLKIDALKLAESEGDDAGIALKNMPA